MYPPKRLSSFELRWGVDGTGGSSEKGCEVVAVITQVVMEAWICMAAMEVENWSGSGPVVKAGLT